MRRGRFWMAFVVAALLALAGMAWLTMHVVELEQAEWQARVRSEQMDRIRLALWRMDAWLNGQLAPEAARPYFDYQAFYNPGRAYSRQLGELDPGEVLNPSPLLGFRSELFPLHFQVGPDGALTSPQAPSGAQRALAQRARLGIGDLRGCEDRLREAASVLRYEQLERRFARASLLPMNCEPVAAAVPDIQSDLQSRFEQSANAKNSIPQQMSWMAIGAGVTPGPLLPLWLDSAQGQDRLVFVRRVELPTGVVYQGFTVDWPRLRASLLAQIGDLFPPKADLVRQDSPDPSTESRTLATVPARLEVPARGGAPPSWSPTRTVLLAAWLAMLLAIAAVGVTLASVLSFAARRSRFASAVTHELRSPLTTFRMYSEMLADGMVTDPARRQEYLTTLCRESERLGRLIENVLAYAGLEEGRRPNERRTVTVTDLLARIAPTLRQRAEPAGFELVVDAASAADVAVHVDPDAIEQVLFALCDNACKYAAVGEPRRIEVRATATTTTLTIAVRDHGPGIPAAMHRRVFRAFDRGGRATGESLVPGVGLGLALARGLARNQNGELGLDDRVTDGCCFVLHLPRAME